MATKVRTENQAQGRLRARFKRSGHQPRNKPQDGGIPPEEGLPVDLRLHVGDQMHAMIALLADQDNISISAYGRRVFREHLAGLGIQW